jgi:hypothetical protein
VYLQVLLVDVHPQDDLAWFRLHQFESKLFRCVVFSETAAQLFNGQKLDGFRFALLGHVSKR